MRAALLALVLMLVAPAGPVSAAVYVCGVSYVYDLENGKLVTASHATSLMATWPMIVFDDDTGVFKYGKEGHQAVEHDQRGTPPIGTNCAVPYFP